MPIPGTRQRLHLDGNVAALGLALSDEELSLLDKVPAATGSRY
jgi:aryl-alcohol dehydrogenase-like predicted oxidoreductase